MKALPAISSRESKRNGITVPIRPTIKDGVERFVADYRVNADRKLVWRSSLADARAAASEVVDNIVACHSEVL
jgi:hypothetical protein